MAELQNKHKVGDIVVHISHPLLQDYYIRGDGKYVPPIMLVKEIILENKQKRTHDESTGKQIAERIKYICIYFDDNKSEFVEVHLYESMITSIEGLYIGRIDDPEKLNTNHINLIDEILNYPLRPEYVYGKILYFKTKKLEVLKKRISKKRISKVEGINETHKTSQYVVNYATPDFIISGFKNEICTDLFYNDGKPKKIVSTELVKVQWFNPIQHKFSEQYLPIELFTDINPFPKISV